MGVFSNGGAGRGRSSRGIAGRSLVLGLLFAVLGLTEFGAKDGTGTPNKGESPLESNGREKKHILLLGASVGREWNIKAFPQRAENDQYIFEYVHGGSSFDKSPALRKVLERAENKPDAIFLKECSAYFPGDSEQYKNFMIRWIKECRENGIVPIPTTVVPVTKFHAFKKFVIDILKLRNPFKYGIPFQQRRRKAILEYNDWVREFCRKTGLPVLDLEASVRYSEANRFLRSDLARLDGLHLKPKAYALLDRIILPTLAQVSWTDMESKGSAQRRER